VGIGGWLVSDYLRMKSQRDRLKQFRVEARAKLERLSGLQEQANDIHLLVMNWKELQEKIQASVPPQQRSSVNGHHTAEQLEKTLGALRSELEGLIASIPSSLPANGRVSSGVGPRLSPWTGKVEFHAGLDIPNPIGTPVYAPADGVVEFVGESNGNGRTVILGHVQGITTLYAHLSKAHVKEGERVRKGQQIANVGSTGNSTSPHLHYEVRVNGVPIDPRRHLLK
jgi:murein DD-endopeptidase MepM/ murein hydrolase activator NlpD